MKKIAIIYLIITGLLLSGYAMAQISGGGISSAMYWFLDGTDLKKTDSTWDVDLDSGNLTTTGIGTFGNVIINGLTASSGVYTDASKQLTSTPPTSGVLGYWDRTGTVLSPSNAGDSVNIGGTGIGKVYASDGTRYARLADGTFGGYFSDGTYEAYFVWPGGSQAARFSDGSGVRYARFCDGTYAAHFNGTVTLGTDGDILSFGNQEDVTISFDGADWIFNSANITANDEVHFTNFDKVTCDTTFEAEQLTSTDDIALTGIITNSGNPLIKNLDADTGGTNSLFIGTDAASNNNGDYNVFMGTGAGQANTTGDNNVFIGSNAGYDNDEGSDNVGIGKAALRNNEDGQNNFALGTNAMYSNVSGSNNVAIGIDAGVDLTNDGNVNIGYRAGYENSSADANTNIGYKAGYNNSTGDRNTNIGYGAGEGSAKNANSHNTMIGFYAGNDITTGGDNIMLGYYAGSKQTTNSNLFIIDNQARADVATELSNSILYGVMAAAPADQSLYINAALHLQEGTAAVGTAPLKFTAGTALTTPECGAMEFNDGRFYITNVAHQRAIDRTSDVAISTVTVANTTTETTLWTGTMAANSLVAGNVFMFHADGEVSNDSANAGDEVTIRIKVGGVTKVTLSPDTKQLTDTPWHLDANATQRTIGATGERAIHIHLVIGDPTSTGDEERVLSVAEIDTTANMDVTITAQWASANANNTISLYQGFMRYKN